MASLKSIVINNFKSFKDEIVIDSLGAFMVVVGPNGCGKSNLLDAVSFAFGVKISSLRARKLQDLIYGSIYGKPAKSAHVSVTLVLKNETEMTFTRSTQGQHSEYKIDEEIVNQEMYRKQLLELGINSQSKSFLILQGMVESISLQSPKERTTFMEQICGSYRFKEEYDSLYQEVISKQDEHVFLSKKKNSLHWQVNDAKKKMEQAKEYEKEKFNLKLELYLFQLFHCEKLRRHFEKLHLKEQNNVEKDEKIQKELKKKLTENEKNLEGQKSELLKLEQEIQQKDEESQKMKSEIVEIKEHISHRTSKVKSCQQLLRKANDVNDNHLKIIENLESELAQLEERRRQYDETVLSDTQSQGVTLNNAQIEEYYKLKQKVAKNSANYIQQLDKLTTEMELKQVALDKKIQKRLETNEMIKRIDGVMKTGEDRLERVRDKFEKNNSILNVKKKQLKKHESQSLEGKETELQEKYETIVNQLEEIKCNKYELEKYERKMSVLKKLQEMYPGIRGRLFSFCKPIHNRYEMAVVKGMVRYMDAIVVDTVDTAQLCIAYLREHRHDRELFLPLNYLKVCNVETKRRNVQQQKGVRLLYDVVDFPTEVTAAILYAFGTTVVCEDTEEARKIASHTDASIRSDAVDLEGTLFCKSGIISGGQVEISRKAKRWDISRLSQLKDEKVKLQKELSDIKGKSRLHGDTSTLKTEITGLEKQLKVLKEMEQSIEQEIGNLEIEKKRLEHLKEQNEASIIETQNSMNDKEISNIKMKLQEIEDKVFADFCSQVGIRDIRQYEKHEVRIYKETMKKKMEFDEQKNCIEVQLEYERKKDTTANVQRWTVALQEETKILDELKKNANDKSLKYEKYLQKLTELKGKAEKKTSEVTKMEKNIKKTYEEIKTLNKKKSAAEKQIIYLQSKIKQQSDKYKYILIQSKLLKLGDSSLPLIRGSMSNIADDMSSSMETSTTSESRDNTNGEQRIVVNFQKLKNEYRDIDNEDKIKEVELKISRAIAEAESKLSTVGVSKQEALKRMAESEKDMKSVITNFKTVSKEFHDLRKRFDAVKTNRQQTLMDCIRQINNDIENIYKSMTKSQNAMVILNVDDESQPYLGGIHICCVVPGKSCQPISSLSGGEKTLVSLAFVFSVLKYQSTPLVLLDEVDAALDARNLKNVMDFFNENSATIQTIVISHKIVALDGPNVAIGISAKNRNGTAATKAMCVVLSDYTQNQENQK